MSSDPRPPADQLVISEISVPRARLCRIDNDHPCQVGGLARVTSGGRFWQPRWRRPHVNNHFSHLTRQSGDDVEGATFAVPD